MYGGTGWRYWCWVLCGVFVGVVLGDNVTVKDAIEPRGIAAVPCNIRPPYQM